MGKDDEKPSVNPQSGPHGKYFLVEVPNFTNAKKPEDEMLSYLRLGAIDPSVAGKPEAGKKYGEDLAVKAKRAMRVDGVNTHDGSAQRSEPYAERELVFEDDVRERGPNDPITLPGSDEELDEEGRLEESARLHTKGGWRDHSDGNRISTTRGDKIEVIRGNYKLIVLGRQKNDDVGKASGFELSGGEIRGASMNLGEFETTSVEWVEDDRGRYRVVEKNQKGDTFSIYWGDVHEEFFGELKEDITGSEDPDSYPPRVRYPGVADADQPKPPSHVNPRVVERTWAESIHGYTGSKKRRVPKIYEETWAKNIEEKTDVDGDTSDKTTVSGTASGETTLGASKEITTISGGALDITTVGGATLGITTVGGAIGEITSSATSTEIAITGAKLDVALTGAALDINVAALVADLDLTLLKIDLTGGVSVGVTIAAALEVFLGAKAEIKAGAFADLTFGAKFELTMGKSLSLIGEHTEVKSANKLISLIHNVTGAKVELG